MVASMSPAWTAPLSSASHWVIADGLIHSDERFVMHKWIVGAIVLTMAAALSAQEAPMTPLRPDQVTFLALYKELVETNTTLSAGSCTLAAARMAAHLKAAGYGDADVTPFLVPEHPKEGGLVAILQGTS